MYSQYVQSAYFVNQYLKSLPMPFHALKVRYYVLMRAIETDLR